MTKQLSSEIEKQFHDNFTIPKQYSNVDRGTYRFVDSKNWFFCNESGDTKMLYVEVGDGFDFTITYWSSSNRLAVMYGHDDDAFADAGDEKHPNFACLIRVPDSEEQYFMDSTVKAQPLPYEFITQILEFMNTAEDIPVVDTIRED